MRFAPRGQEGEDGRAPARSRGVGTRQTTGPVRVDPGSHRIHVELKSMAKVDTMVVVRAGEQVVFDFSRRTLTRTHR